MIKASLFATGLLSCALAAHAQTAAPAPDAGSKPFPPAADALPITGSITVASNYISRGFTQTWGHPALMGELDYANPNGFYLGTTMETLSGREFRSSTMEWDFYGGYTATIGALGYTVGALYYYYPGTSSPLIADQHRYDYSEFKLGATYGIFAVNYYGVMSEHWFGTYTNARFSSYLEAQATFDLGSGYSLLTYGGAGLMKRNSEGNWKDAKIQLTKSFDGGWSVAGAVTRAWDKNRYWTNVDLQADANGGAASTLRLGRTALVATLTKTF